MKRTVLVLFLTLQCVMAFPVDYETAVQIASKYINLSAPAMVMARNNNADMSAKDYYIFNDRIEGNGFVIISGKDDVDPVLGYSDTGFIDEENVPSPLQYFLSQATVSRHGSAKPFRGLQQAQVVVEPLIKTQWYQLAPYNAKCPGEAFFTGCVATAMAQVMNYHKWPERGHGTISYTSYQSSDWLNGTPVGELSCNLAESVYAWDNMLPTYQDGNWNEAQVEAVSTLMRDCGYAAHMQYGTHVSSSYEHDAATGLMNNFGYDTHVYPHFGENDTQTWLALIKRELDNGFPVIVVGQKAFFGGDGHCFIADGYDSNDYIHINWGWNGDADGYYNVCKLTPVHGGEALNYSYMESFVSVHPRRPYSDATYNPWLSMLWDLNNQDLEHSGLTVENEGMVLDSNTSGQIRIDGLACISSYPFRGKFNLVLTDAQGRELKTVASRDIEYKGLNSKYDGQLIGLSSITVDVEAFDCIADGTYRLVPMTVINEMPSQKVQCYGYKNYVNVIISDGKVKLTNVPKPSARLAVSGMISINAEVPMFSKVTGEMEVTNHGDFIGGGTLSVYAAPTDGSAPVLLCMENLAVYEHQALSFPLEVKFLPRNSFGKQFSIDKEYRLVVEMSGYDGSVIELENNLEMPHFKVIYDPEYLPHTTITSVKIVDFYGKELDMDNLELDMNEEYNFNYTFKTEAKDVAPEVFSLELGIEESGCEISSVSGVKTTDEYSFFVPLDLYKSALTPGEQHFYLVHSDFLSSEELVFPQPENLSRLKVKLVDSASAVDNIYSEDSAKETGRYNMQGVKVSSDAKGIVVIYYANGTRRKVFVK